MSIDKNKRYDGLDISHYLVDGFNVHECYDVHKIPNELRQGEYIQDYYRDDFNPENSGCSEVYKATDTELAIVKANIKTRKEAARDSFNKVPKSVLETVGMVVDNAMNNMNYDFYQFDKINTEGMTTGMPYGLWESYYAPVEKPAGPGHIPGINSRALKDGQARPNSVEKMKHKAMVDGFDMMFPHDAMAEYMNYVLSEPFMWRERAFNRAFGMDLSNTTFKAEKFVRAMIDSSGVENRVNFKSRTDLDDDRKMLERNTSKTPDNLHVRNVVAIEQFCAEKPEYVVALFMWTHAMTEYCRDLKSYVREEMGTNQQEIAKEATFWDVIGLVEGGNDEMKHFVTHKPGEKWARIDHGNKVAPTTGPNSFFFLAPVISSVMGALLEESGINYKNASQSDIKPSVVKPAMEKLVLSGIFQRGAGTETSPVLIRCPFAKKLKEMMTLDLGGKDDPKDNLFSKFVEKAREELQAEESNASKHIGYIIGDELKARTRKPKLHQSSLEKLKQHDAKAKGGCPMHHKIV